MKHERCTRRAHIYGILSKRENNPPKTLRLHLLSAYLVKYNYVGQKGWYIMLCGRVGSWRLMPLDALQPKAYCTNPGLLAPPDVSTRDPSSERRKYLGEKWPVISTESIHFRILLLAANMRHGTKGFTSLPKGGVLRIFFALKNPTASAGFEPGQHATSRPPKPLPRLVTKFSLFYKERKAHHVRVLSYSPVRSSVFSVTGLMFEPTEGSS